MAGVFGDEINNRHDFLRELRLARDQYKNLPEEHRRNPVIVAVGKQLDAIEQWTRDGGTPSESDRKSIVMGYQLQREYEYTDDPAIYDLQQTLHGVTNYVNLWPSDALAGDDDNFEHYLDNE